MWLAPEATRKLLQEVPRVYHTQVNDVLLAALGRACGEWSRGEHVLVDLEGHGREEVFPGLDTLRTVGWFTTIYPVLLERGPERTGTRCVAEDDKGAIKDDSKPRIWLWRPAPRGARRSHPQTVGRDAAGLMSCSTTSVRLTRYFRDRSCSESRAKIQAGSPRLENQRPRVLEINALVAEGRLQIAWNYSTKLHRRETIERVAQRYLSACRRSLFIVSTRTQVVIRLQTSRFADFTQEQVDRWIGQGK